LLQFLFGHPEVLARGANHFALLGIAIDAPIEDIHASYVELSRHLDPKQGPRVVQWCEIDGRKYHVVGGRVSHAVVNPTFDPVAKAGALHDYFRGNPEGKNPIEMLREREPIARVGSMFVFDLP